MPNMTVFRKSPWLGTLQVHVLLFLLQTYIGQTTTQTTTACLHDLTGANDIVFLMDRSKSVGLSNFNDMKAFAGQILKKHTIISPNHTRVAVISFGANVTEDINCINASNAGLYECEFFTENGTFQAKVQYQNGTDKSQDMQGEFVDALHLVDKVLDKGKIDRPDVRQVIWLMTDYHEIGKDNKKSSQNLADTLKCEKGVLIFGHGEGRYHNESEKKGLLELVSKPTKWYYDNERTIDTLPWGFTVPEKNSEESTVHQCQEYSNCLLPRDDSEWDTLTYVFFSLGGLALILILLLVPCYWCCCRKLKKHKEESGTISDREEGDIEGVSDICERATIKRNNERPTTPDQYLTTSFERNLHGHEEVTHPGYEQQAIESSTTRNRFLEQFQQKIQQLRMGIVSTVHIKIKRRRRRDHEYENESTVKSISRRYHENSNNAEAETNAGAIITGGQLEAERQNRRSFWPFRKATTSSQHYENEATIERIRQNKLKKKSKDGKQTQREARNKSLLRRFNTNTLQQNETESRSEAGLSAEVPPPAALPAGVHSPTRSPYLELM